MEPLDLHKITRAIRYPGRPGFLDKPGDQHPGEQTNSENHHLFKGKATRNGRFQWPC